MKALSGKAMTNKIIKIFIFTLIVVLKFNTPSFAKDSFCYRDMLENLICKNTLDDIPDAFKAKAFYKETKTRNINSNSYQENLNNTITSPSRHINPNNISNNSSNLPTAKLPPAIENKQQPLQNQKQIRSQNSNIQIFVAEWCPHCKALEQFLKNRNIHYTKYDIEIDEYGKEVYENEGGSIPITKIGKSTIVGFDENRFKSILETQEPY